MSQDQPEALPVPVAAIATTGSDSDKKKVQAASSLESRIDVLRRKTMKATTSIEKRTAIQEWMSQNFLGPSDKSTSGEEQVQDDLKHQGQRKQTSQDKDLINFETDNQEISKGPDNKGQISIVRIEGHDFGTDMHSNKGNMGHKLNTHLGVASKQPYNGILCECSKYLLQGNRNTLVAMGIHLSELCRDLPGNSSKDTQFLSVDGADKGSSGIVPYSPQSSTDENYVGFGLSKGSRKDLLEEIVTFSKLQDGLHPPLSDLHPPLSDLQDDLHPPLGDHRPPLDDLHGDLHPPLGDHRPPLGDLHGDLHPPLDDLHPLPPPEPELGINRHKTDSGFASIATTAASLVAGAGDRYHYHSNHSHQQQQYQFTDIFNEAIEPPPPPPTRRYSKPPELAIDPVPPPGSESTGSAELAKLTSGLEWPSSPLALLSPLVPPGHGPIRSVSPLEEWCSERTSEHFQEDYFSFTGSVDVKCSPHQSLLERFLDEAAGMTSSMNPNVGPLDGGDIFPGLYGDDDVDVDRIFRFPKVPDATQCSAFGPGLELGQVQAKNNFQVSGRLNFFSDM